MRKASSVIITFIAMSFLFFGVPVLSHSENVSKGNIIGFVYDQDGTTPLAGAVVKVKNISTGNVYESSTSDTNGVFRIKGIETGIYLCGVQTLQGDFNSEEFFGVKLSDGETAKLSIALTPYEQKVATALQEVYEGHSNSGESLVGTVIDYYPDNKSADVLVVKGMLRLNDRIHAKGEETDFYQNVEELKFGNSSAKQILAGQTANMKVMKSVDNGDLVYVVCKHGVVPLFLRPLGYATMLGASLGIILGIKDAYNNPVVRPASGYKK
jgi:uncharacterized membrane protein